MLMGFEHPEFSLIFTISSHSCGSSPVLLPTHTPSSTSKRWTLSHLSVLTSAVCPVLPASLWLHLKTLFSYENPLLHYQHTLTCRYSHTQTHKDTQAQMDTSLIPQMNETGNFASHNKVSIYLKWICLYRIVSPPSLHPSLPVPLCPCHQHRR